MFQTSKPPTSVGQAHCETLSDNHPWMMVGIWSWPSLNRPCNEGIFLFWQDLWKIINSKSISPTQSRSTNSGCDLNSIATTTKTHCRKLEEFGQKRDDFLKSTIISRAGSNRVRSFPWLWTEAEQRLTSLTNSRVVIIISRERSMICFRRTLQW